MLTCRSLGGRAELSKPKNPRFFFSASSGYIFRGILHKFVRPLASQLGVDARLMRLQALSGDIYQVYSSSHLVRHKETMTLRFVIISLPLPVLDETANRAALVCDAWIMMIIIMSAFGFSSPDGGRRVSCMRVARLQGRGWVKPCQRPRLDRS